MPISVKVRGGGYKHFDVPIEIQAYILQLESAIITRNFAGIERQYPERFKKDDGWDK